MRKPVYVVDAFTDRPFAGNPAGVLLDGAELDSSTCLRIAAELRHSETAFPLPAREPACAFHLRYFSAKKEVAFCGHATLASLHVMVEEAKLIRVPDQGVTRLSFTCKAGRLRAELSRDEHKKLRILFETPEAKFEQRPVEAELLATLGLIPEALDPNLPPQATPRPASELSNLFIALRDKEALGRARVDFPALCDVSLPKKIGAVCLYSLDPEPGADAQIRFFSPAAGVPEDPVTGSACAQLALLLQMQLPKEMPRHYRILQGAELRRPGRVTVEVRPEERPGQIRAWVGGSAAVVLRGELETGKR